MLVNISFVLNDSEMTVGIDFNYLSIMDSTPTLRILTFQLKQNIDN